MVLALILSSIIPLVYTLWGTHLSVNQFDSKQRSTHFKAQALLALFAISLIVYTGVQNRADAKRAESTAKEYQDYLKADLEKAHQENAELRRQLERFNDKFGFNQAQRTIKACGKPSQEFDSQDPGSGQAIHVLRYGDVELHFTPDGDFDSAFYKRQKIPSENQVYRYLPHYPKHPRIVRPLPEPQPEPKLPSKSSPNNGDGGGAVLVIIGILVFIWLVSKKKKDA